MTTQCLVLLGIVLGVAGAEDPKPGPDGYTATGYLVPARRATAASRAAGRVVELSVKEGRRVKKGDVVARLDAKQQELTVRRAEASLALAEARLARLRAVGAAKEALAEAEAAVKLARAETDLARARLDALTVRAPIDGTVVKVNAELGAWVNPAMQGLVVAASVCEVADLSSLEAEVLVPEKDVSAIAAGRRCEVVPRAAPRKSYRGVVDRVSPVVDTASGAVPVWVRLEGLPEKHGLRVGSAARVTFLQGK